MKPESDPKPEKTRRIGFGFYILISKPEPDPKYNGLDMDFMKPDPIRPDCHPYGPMYTTQGDGGSNIYYVQSQYYKFVKTVDIDYFPALNDYLKFWTMKYCRKKVQSGSF